MIVGSTRFCCLGGPLKLIFGTRAPGWACNFFGGGVASEIMMLSVSRGRKVCF